MDRGELVKEFTERAKKRGAAFLQGVSDRMTVVIWSLATIGALGYLGMIDVNLEPLAKVLGADTDAFEMRLTIGEEEVYHRVDDLDPRACYTMTQDFHEDVIAGIVAKDWAVNGTIGCFDLELTYTDSKLSEIEYGGESYDPQSEIEDAPKRVRRLIGLLV